MVRSVSRRRTDFPTRRNPKLLERAAIAAALFSFVMMGMVLLISDAVQAKVRTETLVIETSKGARTITIELAETAEQKALGLMFRTEMARDHGMLFPYEQEEEITMWMKNTYLSLDMIFIKSDGRVLRVEERTKPLSEAIISSRGRARAVLELVAGTARDLGIKPGDLVRHRIFGTQ